MKMDGKWIDGKLNIYNYLKEDGRIMWKIDIVKKGLLRKWG